MMFSRRHSSAVEGHPHHHGSPPPPMSPSTSSPLRMRRPFRRKQQQSQSESLQEQVVAANGKASPQKDKLVSDENKIVLNESNQNSAPARNSNSNDEEEKVDRHRSALPTAKTTTMATTTRTRLDTEDTLRMHNLNLPELLLDDDNPFLVCHESYTPENVRKAKHHFQRLMLEEEQHRSVDESYAKLVDCESTVSSLSEGSFKQRPVLPPPPPLPLPIHYHHHGQYYQAHNMVATNLPLLQMIPQQQQQQQQQLEHEHCSSRFIPPKIICFQVKTEIPDWLLGDDDEEAKEITQHNSNINNNLLSRQAAGVTEDYDDHTAENRHPEHPQHIDYRLQHHPNQQEALPPPPPHWSPVPPTPSYNMNGGLVMPPPTYHHHLHYQHHHFGTGPPHSPAPPTESSHVQQQQQQQQQQALVQLQPQPQQHQEHHQQAQYHLLTSQAFAVPPYPVWTGAPSPANTRPTLGRYQSVSCYGNFHTPNNNDSNAAGCQQEMVFLEHGSGGGSNDNNRNDSNNVAVPLQRRRGSSLTPSATRKTTKAPVPPVPPLTPHSMPLPPRHQHTLHQHHSQHLLQYNQHNNNKKKQHRHTRSAGEASLLESLWTAPTVASSSHSLMIVSHQTPLPSANTNSVHAKRTSAVVHELRTRWSKIRNSGSNSNHNSISNHGSSHHHHHHRQQDPTTNTTTPADSMSLSICSWNMVTPKAQGCLT